MGFVDQRDVVGRAEVVDHLQRLQIHHDDARKAAFVRHEEMVADDGDALERRVAVLWIELLRHRRPVDGEALQRGTIRAHAEDPAVRLLGDVDAAAVVAGQALDVVAVDLVLVEGRELRGLQELRQDREAGGVRALGEIDAVKVRVVVAQRPQLAVRLEHERGGIETPVGRKVDLPDGGWFQDEPLRSGRVGFLGGSPATGQAEHGQQEEAPEKDAEELSARRGCFKVGQCILPAQGSLNGNGGIFGLI